MQVAMNAEIGGGERFGYKIIAGICTYFPFRGKADVTADPYSMGIGSNQTFLGKAPGIIYF
jgi:hypothetical protein